MIFYIKTFYLIGIASLVTCGVTACSETIKTEEYYLDDNNIKEFGITLRECDEAIRDKKEMSTIQSQNCKTARKANTKNYNNHINQIIGLTSEGNSEDDNQGLLKNEF